MELAGLKRIMQERRLNARQVAQLTDRSVSHQTVRNILTERSDARRTTLGEIARGLKVKVNHLL